MLEMDNQIQENQQELDYILPDDYEEEGTPTEPESEEVDEQEPAQEQEFDLRDLEIKHFKDVKKLKDFTTDELKEYVQKGIDYDRVKEQRTKTEEQLNGLKGFSDISKLYGYEPSEFMDLLRNNHFAAMAESNGTSEEFERKNYELTLKEQQLLAMEADKQTKDKQAKDIEAFIQEYPSIDPSTLPKEVVDAVNSGESLKTAYIAYENKQLRAELERAKKLVSNVKSAPVKSTTGNGGSDPTENDDFLSGLFG